MLVRAFSTFGYENFAAPPLSSQQVDLFCAGAEPDGPVTKQLIREIGLQPVCLGGLEALTVMDGLTRARFTLAFG